MGDFQGEEWTNLMSGYETDFEQGDQAETQIASLTQKFSRIWEKIRPFLAYENVRSIYKRKD